MQLVVFTEQYCYQKSKDDIIKSFFSKLMDTVAHHFIPTQIESMVI